MAVFENINKNIRFRMFFLEAKATKNRLKVVSDFFSIIDFFSFFFGCWLHFGKPRGSRALQQIAQNRSRCSKNLFGGVFRTRMFLKVSLGRILEGFGDVRTQKLILMLHKIVKSFRMKDLL